MTPSLKRDAYKQRYRENRRAAIKTNNEKTSLEKREAQLAHISKLVLDSKIKKFSDSFICGKGYSPPSGGE